MVLFLVKMVGNKFFCYMYMYLGIPVNVNVCNLCSVSDGFAMIAFGVLYANMTCMYNAISKVHCVL